MRDEESDQGGRDYSDASSRHGSSISETPSSNYDDSDSSGSESDSSSDSDSPRHKSRGRKRRRKYRKDKHSSRKRTRRGRSSSRSESRSRSSHKKTAYQRFEPGKDKSGGWRLNEEQKEYALKAYTKYRKEDEMKDLIEKNPRPEHKFLRNDSLDRDIKAGLEEDKDSLKAKLALKRDKGLSHAQEKILRTMGPLAKLWAALDKARESGTTQAMDLLELLQWAEQAVLANGQAVVALKYQRRFEVMTTIMSVKEAQDLLKTHEEDFSRSGTLFGAKVQEKMEAHAKTRNGSSGIFAMRRKGKKRQHRSDRNDRGNRRKPFRDGSPRSRSNNRGGRNKRGRSDRGNDRQGNNRRGRGGDKGNRGQDNRYVSCIDPLTLKTHKMPSDSLSNHVLLLPRNNSAARANESEPDQAPPPKAE